MNKSYKHTVFVILALASTPSFSAPIDTAGHSVSFRGISTSPIIDTTSVKPSTINMPHKYDPGKKCTTARFLGKKIAEGCYRVYEDVHSNNPNHFTINTDIDAEAYIFTSGRKRVEFIANGWEKGLAGRATRAWFKVNGKTVANIYQRKYGSDNAGSVYTTPFIKNIGSGKWSVGVGPVSVTVGARIEANVKPAMYVHAQNSNPASTKNGWVRVIHRDSVKLNATTSAGGSVLGFGLGAKGRVKLVDLNTGLVSPKDTKLLLKRTTSGNKYYNQTRLNACFLGGKIDVWAKAFWKKYSKTIFNRNGSCLPRKQLVNINQMIEYPNPSQGNHTLSHRPYCLSRRLWAFFRAKFYHGL